MTYSYIFLSIICLIVSGVVLKLKAWIHYKTTYYEKDQIKVAVIHDKLWQKSFF